MTYEQIMLRVDELMKKGEDNLSKEEIEELGKLAKEAEEYEDEHFPMPFKS